MSCAPKAKIPEHKTYDVAIRTQRSQEIISFMIICQTWFFLLRKFRVSHTECRQIRNLYARYGRVLLSLAFTFCGL